MGTELIDRRIRKTRKQLKDCLISLLKTKRIQDITVRELTEMADLNRGTFYLHYKDVFDLLEQTETELLGKLNSVIQKHRAEELLDRPFNIFHEVYTLVYENASLVEILLGENGDLNFLNRMKQICVINVFTTGWKWFVPKVPQYLTPTSPSSFPAAWGWCSTG